MQRAVIVVYKTMPKYSLGKNIESHLWEQNMNLNRGITAMSEPDLSWIECYTQDSGSLLTGHIHLYSSSVYFRNCTSEDGVESNGKLPYYAVCLVQSRLDS